MAPRAALVALANAADALAVVDRLLADGIRVAVLGDAVPGADLVLPPGDAAEAVARVERELGSLSILVCTAPSPAPARFVDTAPADWFAAVHAAMSVPFRLVRAAAPALRRSGDARIVLVGAGWSAAAAPDSTAAAAVQGAMVAFTKTLARDLGPEGVTVNEIAVSPGTSAPAALASAVAYLAGPQGAAMVGQILTLGRGGEVRP